MRDTWVRSLGREDPLEKEMATHSNTIAWKIPWMEDYSPLIDYSPWGCKELDVTERLHFHFTLKPQNMTLFGTRISVDVIS